MPRILVIEDDTEFNQILCKALTKRGYNVVSAENGKIGVNLYKKYLADLVITDILMPEQDGIEVILHLKKVSPGVKIIAISGGGKAGFGQEYLQWAKTMGNIQCVFAKPFRRDQLFQTIQEILM